MLRPLSSFLLLTVAVDSTPAPVGLTFINEEPTSASLDNLPPILEGLPEGEPCSICGEGFVVANSTKLLTFPGSDVPYACGDTQEAGWAGIIPAGFCVSSFTEAFIEPVCGCVGSSAPVTLSPVTPTPTTSPVTSLPSDVPVTAPPSITSMTMASTPDNDSGALRNEGAYVMMLITILLLVRL